MIAAVPNRGEYCTPFVVRRLLVGPVQSLEGPSPPGAPQATPPRVSNRKRRDQGGDFENKDGWNVIEVIVQEDRSSHVLNGVRLNTMSGFEQPDPRNPGQFIPLTQAGSECAQWIGAYRLPEQ